ncbi:MAG: hypothetical protein IJ481_03160 [Alphaproteobacteria bacterium]|nr:hypothetical protein [Alphaproteobacteria bacterium]
MKDKGLLFSLIIHATLIIATFINFKGTKDRAIKDTGHAIYDFKRIGPKSTAPIISETPGDNKKSKIDKKETDDKKQQKQAAEQKKTESNKRVPLNKNTPKANKKKDKNKTQNKKKNTPKTIDKALKNITPNPQEQKQKAKKSLNSMLDNAASSDIGGVNAEELGDELTATEVDVIRQTIRKCWHMPAGLKNAEELIVELKMELDPLGYVQKAEIQNKERMSDPNFKIAAENAQRAVLDPMCNPIPLPKEKYEQWKDLELTFNPNDLY